MPKGARAGVCSDDSIAISMFHTEEYKAGGTLGKPSLLPLDEIGSKLITVGDDVMTLLLPASGCHALCKAPSAWALPLLLVLVSGRAPGVWVVLTKNVLIGPCSS